MKKVGFSLLIAIIAHTTFGQNLNLGFNLKLGETYYTSMKATIKVHEIINNEEFNIDLSSFGKIAFKVMSLKDSIYDLNVNYEQLTLTMNLPNGEFFFSSDKVDINDIFSTILKELIGKNFSMKMTKIGKIVEVGSLDSFFESLFAGFPNLTAEQKEQITVQLQKAYGAKAFKGSFEVMTNIYSNAAVQQGDTWKITTHLESGMASTLITTFEYKERTEKYNLIIGTGKFKSLDKDAYIDVQGTPMKYDLTGTIHSILKSDINTGWIIEGEYKQILSGTAEIQDSPSFPGGLIIPITSENLINIAPVSVKK